MKPIGTDIIEGCKKSERRSQHELYDHCYDDMIRLCRLHCINSEDAGALYNTAMLKVFTNINQCKDEASLMGWIRRVVVNTCIDHCRQHIKESVYPVDIIETKDVFISPEVYDKISAEESLQLLKQLPPNTAMVFTLFVIEGYKHDEISQLLGIPVGTSKWQLNEARKLLKQKLEALKKTKIYSNVI